MRAPRAMTRWGSWARMPLLLAAGCTHASSVGSGPSVAVAPTASFATAPKSDWIQMFNGRDLTGWDVKFAKHELNDN